MDRKNGRSPGMSWNLAAIRSSFFGFARDADAWVFEVIDFPPSALTVIVSQVGGVLSPLIRVACYCRICVVSVGAVAATGTGPDWGG